MAFPSGFEHIVHENEPLAPYTRLGLGGIAEYFAEPTSVTELSDLVAVCREEEIPFRVLGGGTNLLVRDGGVPGLVIHLSAGAFSAISVDGHTIRAGGGAKLGHLVSASVREGLAGLEQLVGIPGTVGGALRGNADAGGADIGQTVRSAIVMDGSGKQVSHQRNSLRFSYRKSNLDELILTAEFELAAGDPQELTKRMQKLWILRKSQQPQGWSHFAYMFKDTGGGPAAALIEQAGLKGAKVGKAAVSNQDANFVVAEPGATSADVVGLIQLIRDGVAQRLGVELEQQLEVW